MLLTLKNTDRSNKFDIFLRIVVDGAEEAAWKKSYAVVKRHPTENIKIYLLRRVYTNYY